MNKLTVEQREHAMEEWKRKYDNDVFTEQARLIFFEGYKSALNANTEEGCEFYPCDWYDDYKKGLTQAPNRNQIALRKIEEFMKSNPDEVYRDKVLAYERTMVNVETIFDWLKQEADE